MGKSEARGRAGGPAQWRGRDWQIAPGADAQRTGHGRRRDPHRVSLLVLSPEQCLLSPHRASAAALAVCLIRHLTSEVSETHSTACVLSLPSGRYLAVVGL